MFYKSWCNFINKNDGIRKLFDNKTKLVFLEFRNKNLKDLLLDKE